MVHDVCYHNLHPNLSRGDAEVQLTVVSKCMSVGLPPVSEEIALDSPEYLPKPKKTRRHSSATVDHHFDDFTWRSTVRPETAADRGCEDPEFVSRLVLSSCRDRSHKHDVVGRR